MNSPAIKLTVEDVESWRDDLLRSKHSVYHDEMNALCNLALASLQPPGREAEKLWTEEEVCRHCDLLIDAILFYADPATYHAIAFLPDPPCGEFIDDFATQTIDDFYERPMPGKMAREAIEKWNASLAAMPKPIQPPPALDERERFEKWAVESECLHPNSLHERLNDGYAHTQVQWLWLIWQAAIASGGEAG